MCEALQTLMLPAPDVKFDFLKKEVRPVASKLCAFFTDENPPATTAIVDARRNYGVSPEKRNAADNSASEKQRWHVPKL